MLLVGILVTVMLALAFPMGSAFALERGLATIGPERLAADALCATRRIGAADPRVRLIEVETAGKDFLFRVVPITPRRKLLMPAEAT